MRQVPDSRRTYAAVFALLAGLSVGGCSDSGTRTATPTVSPVSSTATPTIALSTLTGSCAAPGNGSHGLGPCDSGTPITVFRCDNRAGCLHHQGLSMLAATTVTSEGRWALEVPLAESSEPLLVEAGITDAVVYRAVGFNTLGAGALRAGLARELSIAAIAITPVTEAAVELVD